MNEPKTTDAPKSLVDFDLARTLLILVGVIALVGLLYLAQSTHATLTGKRVVKLQQRLEMLRRENAQLEYEIAVLTAPHRIAERATRLGLRPLTPTQAKYIVITDYPAMFSATPSAMTSTSPPSALEVLLSRWRERAAGRSLASP
ncbi:MAG: hypothetical protein N2559_00590 [Anaerolineae bacterium]|nr:hypothetical protein [Anaerolineae bacterium]